MKAIVAIDEENGIGKNGTIPWHNKEDMAHFKFMTSHSHVIMGRKTWDSLPPSYRPLPNRVNHVMTKSDAIKVEDLESAVGNNLHIHRRRDSAIRAVLGKQVFIIGGGDIYNLFKDYIEEWIITYIRGKHECDTFFNIDLSEFETMHTTELETCVIRTWRRIR